MMFQWKRLAALSALAALALTGCATTSTNSTSNDASLTLGVLVPATTFSAQDANWANESPYMQAVYDGLVRANPDGSIVPWLATKWSFDPTNTKLTMTLRDDVTFTDGTKFTASSAAENLVRFRDGNSPNKSDLALLAGAKALNPTTLEIDLKEPDPAILSTLSRNAGLQESPKAFNSTTIKTVPVGSGPYTLDTNKTVVGSSYVFDKNPKYWAPDSVHYGKLALNVYSDATALLNAIKGGQINGSTTINNDTLDQIKAAGFAVDPIELSWTGLFLFDRAGVDDKALSDVRVRQAINYAFDRKALLKAVGQGYGTVTTQIFPTNSPGYDPSLDSYYTYDPTKAKQLLKEAGYGSGLTLSEPSTPLLGEAVYPLIAQQLKDVGIKVTFTPSTNFAADMLAPKWGSTYMILQEDPTAWQIANFSLLPTAPFNPFHYSDPTVLSLAKIIQTGSTADADAATKKLDAYIVKQAWFAPWYRLQTSFVTDAKTAVKVQHDNAYPYLWNFTPKA